VACRGDRGGASRGSSHRPGSVANPAGDGAVRGVGPGVAGDRRSSTGGPARGTTPRVGPPLAPPTPPRARADRPGGAGRPSGRRPHRDDQSRGDARAGLGIAAAAASAPGDPRARKPSRGGGEADGPGASRVGALRPVGPRPLLPGRRPKFGSRAGRSGYGRARRERRAQGRNAAVGRRGAPTRRPGRSRRRPVEVAATRAGAASAARPVRPDPAPPPVGVLDRCGSAAGTIAEPAAASTSTRRGGPPIGDPAATSAPTGPENAMDTVERVGPEAFDEIRLLRPGAWAVAFLADWCPFCREFAPRFGALSTSGARLLIADMTSEQSPLWDRFGVEVVPTVIVFRDGAATARIDGQAGYGLDSSDLSTVAAALAARPRGPGAAPSGKGGGPGAARSAGPPARAGTSRERRRTSRDA
jgi:thioredoxin 1